jgi:hypothetical protein
MEGYERKESISRDLEKDKKSFIEAIENTSIEEVPTQFDESSATSLSENLKGTKLFLLGEMHGVKENPAIIYTLFKKFGFRNLALEWDSETKKTAEKFLATGELDFDSIRESPDGRITSGHFALLRKLKEEGLLKNLVCFDWGAKGDSWDDRDASMATNIMDSLSEEPTLVVAGNLHAQVEPVVFDDQAEPHHPMGEQVKNKLPNVSSGSIEYLSGEFHNYGTRSFNELNDHQIPASARFYKSANGLYTLELPVAYVAVVPNPDERLIPS